MWRFLTILCAIVHSSSADDIPEIKIDIFMNKQGQLQCSGTAPPLIVNKPHQVYVNYSENIYRARSQSHDEILTGAFTKERHRAGYLAKGYAIAPQGQWNYECQFYTKQCLSGYMDICYYHIRQPIYQDKGVNCNFFVHVFKQEEFVKNYLTGYLTANVNNFSIPWTRESYVYYFYDGEPVDFVCYKTTESFIQLSYTTKAGTNISTGFQQTFSVVLYMKLSAAENDHTFLTCTIKEQTQRLQNVIQLELVYNVNRNYKKIGFIVNGLILPTIKQKDNTDYYYEYKYYPGERLVVDIVKDQLYGDATCGADGKNVPSRISEYFKTARIESSYVVDFNESNTNTTLICTVPLNNKEFGKKTSKNWDRIIITFRYHSPDYSPYIKGLSMARVLMKYTNSTTNVIHYDYVGNETLNLSCFTPPLKENTSWNYNQQAFVTSNEPDFNIRHFQLVPNINEAYIRCSVVSSTDKTTHVNLTRRNALKTTVVPPTPEVIKGPSKPKQPQTNTEGLTDTQRLEEQSTATTKNIATKKPDIPAKPKMSPTNKAPNKKDELNLANINNNNLLEKKGYSFGIVAAVVVVTIVTIAVLSWMAVDLRHRKYRQQNNPADIDYQNLPRHNEGPMQTPDQWNSRDDDTYAVPFTTNNEGLYSKPIPKNLRPKVKNRNAHGSKNSESTNALNESTYASIQNGEPTYESVQKHQAPQHPLLENIGENYVNLETKTTVENDITYAEIYNKGESEQFVPKSSQHPAYGQIKRNIAGEQKYANLEELNRKLATRPAYENVNARQEEIEPAYCEVNAKKQLKSKK